MRPTHDNSFYTVQDFAHISPLGDCGVMGVRLVTGVMSRTRKQNSNLAT